MEGALNANINVCIVVSLKMLSINEIDKKIKQNHTNQLKALETSFD